VSLDKKCYANILTDHAIQPVKSTVGRRSEICDVAHVAYKMATAIAMCMSSPDALPRKIFASIVRRRFSGENESDNDNGE